MADAAAVPQDAKPVGFISAFKRESIRILAVSRASSRLAQATVSYGSMVFLASQGGSQLQISVVAASTYVSALLFGLQGGTLADSFSKRMAIVAGYVALALLCITVPLLFGTGVTQLMLIMFLSSALMQVISPSLKSAVALVASPDEMATVSVAVSISGSIASAIGSSMLAPILIRLTGIKTLLFVAGLIYLIGAVRTYKLPVQEEGMRFRDALGSVDWRPKALSRRSTATWLMAHRSVGSVILVGAIVVSLFEAFSTLIPVYVRDVLKADPTNAVYIFAPAGIGFLIGTLMTPALIKRIGARRLAVTAATITAGSMMLFGLIDQFDSLIAPASPLRIFGWALGIEINDRVLAASLIAVPANFGSTAAGASVQTFINQRVPVVNQGATFGIQEVQENIFTLLLVVALGILSTFMGPKAIFLIAPLVTVSFVLSLIRYSYRISDQGPITARNALDTLIGDDHDHPADSASRPKSS